MQDDGFGPETVDLEQMPAQADYDVFAFTSFPGAHWGSSPDLQMTELNAIVSDRDP